MRIFRSKITDKVKTFGSHGTKNLSLMHKHQYSYIDYEEFTNIYIFDTILFIIILYYIILYM